MTVPHVATSFRLVNPSLRSCWIVYLSVALISSLLGDSVILVSSIGYNAIKLNPFLVTIIQHLAVCDILSAVVFVLPTLVSLIADKWVLGTPLAYLHLYMNQCTYQINNYLISILVCSKLLRLRFPHRTKSFDGKLAHVVCGVVWVLALIYPAVRLSFDQHGVVFSYINYNIDCGISSEYTDADTVLMYLFVAVIGVVLFLLVLGITVGTLFHLIGAWKSSKTCGGEVRWQGIVTVVATATVHCISSLPDMAGITATLTLSTLALHTMVTIRRVGEAMNALNIMANFYIYFLAVPSFRTFVMGLVSGFCGKIAGKMASLCGRNTNNQIINVENATTEELFSMTKF